MDSSKSSIRGGIVPESMLERLEQNSSAGIYVLQSFPDGSQSLPYFSKALQNLFEVDAINPLNDASRMFRRLHPDDLPEFYSAFKRSQEKLSLWKHEFRIVVPSAGTRRLMGSSMLELQGDGSVIWTGQMLDVTRDLELPESANLRARAIEAAPYGIITVDARLPDLPIVFVNPAFCEITGYSVLDAMHKNGPFLQGQEGDQSGLMDMRKAIAEGSAVNTTIRNYRKNSIPFWNELSIKPVHNDADELTHFIGTMKDVTQELEMYSELTDSENRFRTLAGNALIGIYVWRTTSGVEFVNGKFMEITSLTFEEALNSDWGARLHPDDRERAVNRWRHASETRSPSENEFRFIRNDTELVWILSTSVPFTDETGEIVGRIGTFTDITERKYTAEELVASKQEAEDANKVKNLFLARTSHELRTPLNAVRGRARCS